MRSIVLLLVAVCSVPSAVSAADAPAPNLRVAGIVLKWVRGDKEANYRRLEPLIREAAKNGAELIVTTECCLDGYAIADKTIPLGDYLALGEPVPGGAYFQRFRALARELHVHLVAGMLESDGTARYNTAVLIGPDGRLVGKYRKQKLGHESVRNTAGTVSTVHETRLGKMGVMICADRTDRDIVARYSQNGARLLVCPSGGMFGERKNDPIVQARSRENRLPIVFVHPAEFLVTGPDGSILSRFIAGDRLLVSRDEIGGATDLSRIGYIDLPRTAPTDR
jgi:predicted amidohydrolase